MTIHSSQPFADPDPDPARRFRGRLTGTVALLTARDGAKRAGLTVSSLMVANGERPRVLALVDPDSDLADAVSRSGRAVVQLLSWSHRDLADPIAGTAPPDSPPLESAMRALRRFLGRRHRLIATVVAASAMGCAILALRQDTASVTVLVAARDLSGGVLGAADLIPAPPGG